jgi:serine/threonine protein kinase
VVRRAEQVCDRFEAAWKAGERPLIEDHVASVPEPERAALLRELILLEVDYRRLAGDVPRPEEFLDRFPSLDRAWLAGVLAEDALPTHIDSGHTGQIPAASGRLGKFVLLQQLGRGGCGTVWKAHDTELDRVVAVKIPNPDLITSPVLQARFRREARAVARLAHPNIVTLYAVEQVGDTPLLVMEYVEGIDLARRVKQSGPLPVGQACDCVCQAALGLHQAHERGLIHRDVKPSNLLLTAGGTVVKVLDLGMVRLQSRPEDQDTTLTGAGHVVGTADFMAPEQARDARSADARADVYGLGCTLYYLLTARVPFPGGTASEKLVRRSLEEPEPVERLQPAVSPALAGVVRKMMARRPEDRYQSAAEVVAALTAVLAGTEPGPRRAARRWRPVFLASGLGTFALLLSLLLWGWPGRSGPLRQEQGAGPPAQLEEFPNSIGMRLKLIRPGRFLMGGRPGEGGPPVFEKQHWVDITQPFYIGVCEVTQEEFQTVMRFNPSFFTVEKGGGPRHPVEMVDYDLAVEFCELLSDLPDEKRARRVYRLPREAEWEYACRAGTRTPFHFGDDPGLLGDYAWFQGNSGGHTHPVGGKKENPWGLYDMYGNVWEWCADTYEDHPNERVLRGGGWGEFGNPRWCRSAARGHSDHRTKTNYHGLRVVFTVPTDAP